jgi:hypothetical protein
MTASTDGATTSPAASRSPDATASTGLSRRTAGGWTLAAGLVDVVQVVSLLLFYSLEIGKPKPHLWGPLSDGSSAVFDLLLLPLLWFVVTRLPARTPARWYALVALVGTAVGAVNSGLLVLGLMNDAVSFVLTMVVIGVQAGWFVLMGRRGREVLGLSRGVERWALLGGLGMLAAIVLFVPAILLPSSSPIGLVLWILLGVIGGIGWISWPAWLIVTARTLLRLPRSADRYHLARRLDGSKVTMINDGEDLVLTLAPEGRDPIDTVVVLEPVKK